MDVWKFPQLSSILAREVDIEMTSVRKANLGTFAHRRGLDKESDAAHPGCTYPLPICADATGPHTLPCTNRRGVP
jgi:hypothetical protein